MMCKLWVHVSFHLPAMTVDTFLVKLDDSCFAASQRCMTANGKCFNWLNRESETLGRQNLTFGKGGGIQEKLCRQGARMAASSATTVSQWLVFYRSHQIGFFRDSWKINLTWLEIWYKLSSMPLGSLSPQNVLADLDSHELLFHLRSNRIK